MPRLRRLVIALCLGWLGARAFAALRPTAYPYIGWPLMALPHPLITRSRLLEVLAPASGERVLEIGPGTGYYTLAVAERLGPDGALAILDVSQHFLDHTARRARARGLTNIEPTLGDGASLPYPDGSFDAAYLVTVLGEIADPTTALAELRRVLKPRGRLVVGEILYDPDYTTPRWLDRHSRAAGLELERRTGTPLAYFARLTPATATPA